MENKTEDCAIKKLNRLNKLAQKNKLPRVTFSTHGNSR